MINKNTDRETTGREIHDPSTRSAVKWYVAGFTLLGWAIGYFAGSSQSPVIGSLLPLLFGLIGGASGLYLTQADLGDPKAVFRLRILGKALVLFVVFALIGTAFGISFRTGRSIWAFLSPQLFLPEKHYTFPDNVRQDPEKSIELAFLRAKIRALGVSKTEEQDILSKTAQLMEGEGLYSEIGTEILDRLAGLSYKAENALSDAITESERNAEQIPYDFKDLESDLRNYSEHFIAWAEQINGGIEIPGQFLATQINQLKRSIDNSFFSSNERAWIFQHEEAYTALCDLQWELIYVTEKLETDRWLDEEMLAQIDDFLGVFYSGSAKSGERAPWINARPSHAD